MSLAKKIVGVVLAVIYIISLFSLIFPFALQQGLFISPDEHAVWVFAQNVAQTGIAHVFEQRNDVLFGMLHPRSAVTLGSYIVPSGFLGMPYLVGALFFFSPVLASSAGPIFSCLGLAVLYMLLRRLGGTREFSLLSVGLLAIHPAWWYYSIRSLMPNVPFTVCLLVAVYLGVVGLQSERRKMVWGLGSGMMLSGAIALRASEWLWIGGLLCSLVIYVQATCSDGFFAWLKKHRFFFFGWTMGILGGAIVILSLQSIVYGSALVTGYTVHTPVWEVGGAFAQTESVSWYQKVFGVLFPFGIHERATLRNVWSYLVALYPWMTVVGIFGVMYVVRNRLRNIKEAFSSKRRFPFLLSLMGVSVSLAYMLILYGSWVFFDNPDPRVISLGNSHVRYWLPLIVALIPAAAYAILRIRDVFASWSRNEHTKKLVMIFPAAVFLLMSIFSAHAVFAGDDGVLHMRQALETFAQKRSAVLEATPKDAIIIVDRADKYLWPDRAVIVPLRDEKTYAALPQLVAQGKVYYFSITLPDADRAYLEGVTLAQTGIIFTPIITLDEETLYEIHLQ